MRIYIFRPRKALLLSGWEVKALAELESGVFEVSVNLGRGSKEVVVKGDEVVFPGKLSIKKQALAKIVDESGIYAVGRDGLYKLAWFSGRMYLKLKAVKRFTAPTLEIDGIHMHRVEGTTPWRDAREKVFAAGVSRGDKVLDICTGLGYTAIHALRMHASKVVTIEKYQEVLEMAELNPWSWELADRRVTIVLEDAVDALRWIVDEAFDKIIHDPPRLARAGELYSLDFYRELYRVLKPGGRLFHYTGAPGRARGVDVLGGVSGRLKRVGFRVKARRDLMGVVAEKPRYG